MTTNRGPTEDLAPGEDPDVTMNESEPGSKTVEYSEDMTPESRLEGLNGKDGDNLELLATPKPMSRANTVSKHVST